VTRLLSADWPSRLCSLRAGATRFAPCFLRWMTEDCRFKGNSCFLARITAGKFTDQGSLFFILQRNRVSNVGRMEWTLFQTLAIRDSNECCRDFSTLITGYPLDQRERRQQRSGMSSGMSSGASFYARMPRIEISKGESTITVHWRYALKYAPNSGIITWSRDARVLPIAISQPRVCRFANSRDW